MFQKFNSYTVPGYLWLRRPIHYLTACLYRFIDIHDRPLTVSLWATLPLHPPLKIRTHNIQSTFDKYLVEKSSKAYRTLIVIHQETTHHLLRSECPELIRRARWLSARSFISWCYLASLTTASAIALRGALRIREGDSQRCHDWTASICQSGA